MNMKNNLILKCADVVLKICYDVLRLFIMFCCVRPTLIMLMTDHVFSQFTRAVDLLTQIAVPLLTVSEEIPFGANPKGWREMCVTPIIIHALLPEVC